MSKNYFLIKIFHIYFGNFIIQPISLSVSESMSRVIFLMFSFQKERESWTISTDASVLGKQVERRLVA